MRKRICFIDDDDRFEIPLFLEVFGDAFDLVAGTNFETSHEKIKTRKDWHPDLFVLDMYFPAGDADEKTIESLASHPLKLPADNGEIRAAYMNFQSAKNRLELVLKSWNQGPQGGLALAARVSKSYPGVPIVFYSRKATAMDVLHCLNRAGILDVISKPTGRDDADTRQLTLTMKDDLVQQFADAMDPAEVEKRSAVKAAAGLVLEQVCYFHGGEPKDDHRM